MYKIVKGLHVEKGFMYSIYLGSIVHSEYDNEEKAKAMCNHLNGIMTNINKMKLKDLLKIEKPPILAYIVNEDDIVITSLDSEEDDMTDYFDCEVLSVHESLHGLVIYVRKNEH